jgi:hypothetical protein
MPLSSPPTSDLRLAPICEPTWRERTVRPKASPITSTSYPGRSFPVVMSIYASLAATQTSFPPAPVGRDPAA